MQNCICINIFYFVGTFVTLSAYVMHEARVQPSKKLAATEYGILMERIVSRWSE